MNASRSNARFHGIAEEWLRRLPTPDGKRFVTAFEHGSLAIELYAPRGADLQTPHTRDEVYVVVQGTGFFVNGPERQPIGPGDLIFVPAGIEHRFEEFTDDLAVWVVFYGPEGGESA
jgi:mannose-6-phosphate isomerase-like protein (cupin superfamily)